MAHRLAIGLFLALAFLIPSAKAQAPLEPFKPLPVLNSTTTIAAYIAAQNVPHAYDIADCESDFVYTAKNASSTASGVFQFLRGTWSYYGTKLWGSASSTKDVFNARDNIELGLWVIETYGTHDWDASKHCWGKLVAGV